MGLVYIKDMEATPIKNAMVPIRATHDASGNMWLVFSYSDEDKPWKWPKALKYDGRVFVWMSWSSDTKQVNYKEACEAVIAFPTKNRA